MSRNFVAAVRCAQEAEALACTEVQICDYDAPLNPTYSIIVVLYQKHSDLEEAVSRLSRYADRPQFELIFVNNGNFSPQEILPKYLGKFRWIEVGFNYGCSGGRNLGARAARGRFLIFIDDDGLIEDHSIEHLIDTITKHDALAVRGRVFPKHQPPYLAPHYDLGDEIIYSWPNTEGISIWQRQEFLEVGGFDTLLAGKEGISLWSKLYKIYALRSFLYTPYAILLHDYAKNQEHFNRKKAKDTPNEGYFLFAYSNAQRSYQQAALEFTRRAVEIDPDNAKLRHHLGNLLQQQGRLHEAEAAHRRAVEREPLLSGPHRQLSMILDKQGRKDEAIAAARCAVECDPDNAKLHQRLGKLLQKQGKLDQAESAHRRATELEPYFAGAHQQLSVVLTQQDRHDEAFAAAQRAVELDPNNAKLHHHLTNLLQKLDQLDEAEATENKVRR